MALWSITSKKELEKQVKGKNISKMCVRDNLLCEEFLSIKKKANPLGKWTKVLMWVCHTHKELQKIHMYYVYMFIHICCSTLLLNEKMKCHFLSIRLAKIQRFKVQYWWRYRCVNWCILFGRQCCSIYWNLKAQRD